MADYPSALFAATHNSYSPGRGPLAQQLQSGVRFLELDVHREGGRYRIGHLGPGAEVAKGHGYPSDDRLASWLGVVAQWARANDHAPIVIGLDLKSPLHTPDSFADGNLSALNAVIRDAFGDDLLFTAEEHAREGWPALAALRNRVLCVMSGNHDSRMAYLRDGGLHPAVALDDAGNVFEVHRSGRDALWYWTGKRDGERVVWRRHGRVGDGRDPVTPVSDGGRRPAVAFTGAGRVAVVHGARLTLGALDEATGEISWRSSKTIGLADAREDPEPVITFASAQQVRITYASSHGRRACIVALDSFAVEASEATGADARVHPNHASCASREVSVGVIGRDDGDGEMLIYGTEALPTGRIRFEQVAFVEAKDGEPVYEQVVIAAPVSKWQWARDHRAGRLVRLWGFEQDAARIDFTPNFPATDHPEAAWYQSYLRARGHAAD